MHCGQAVRTRTPDDEARHSRLAATAPQSLADKVRTAVISGERRVVTVLFADVVGSTALSESLDLETWSKVMNGAFDQITPAVYRYEGTIAHLLGDSLVAFFGAPVAHEDDPLRAVHAALDSLDRIHDYAQNIVQRLGIDFAMRFCLNTGPVIVGPIGRDLRYDYTAMGGAVNLAARLKFSARPMSVMVSENTHRFIAPYFDTQDLGSIEVKDLPEQVRVYQVVQPKAMPGTLRGLAGLFSPLVGRDHEFNILMKTYEAVRSGLGRAVLMNGEPGLGKTRLIAEWQAAVAQSHHAPAPQWIEGRCLSYGQGMAYHLVLDLLRSLLGLPITAQEADLHDSLLAVVQDLFGGNSTHLPKARKSIPFSATCSQLTWNPSEEHLRLLDPQALQAHYQTAVRQLLQALASRRPLIVVLEDLHWADPSSVDLLIRFYLSSCLLRC
jgi:class 3 adenylate cyclase